jgi:hypothetical protein
VNREGAIFYCAVLSFALSIHEIQGFYREEDGYSFINYIP